MDKSEAVIKLHGIANYQFSASAGRALFPKDIEIEYSPKTGRIRRIYHRGVLLATLRPRDGMFSLTIPAAKRLASKFKPPQFRVIVQDDVAQVIRQGGTVFAKHILKADHDIRPQEEVIVTNLQDEVLAVGRAILNGEDMITFNFGAAVKVRHGAEE